MTNNDNKYLKKHIKNLSINLKTIIIILSIFLLISIALNGFFINKIHKFRKTVTAYKVYADGLYTKLNNIQQKANKIELGVNRLLRKALRRGNSYFIAYLYNYFNNIN